MKRSKHTLSHYRMVTANMGELFPIACIPVLPGDTVQMHTNALVRVTPLNTPVMHPTQVRIHHFFVPNRLSWDGWEDFITGGPDGMDDSTPPTFESTDTKKSLQTYLGVPPIAGVDYNSLPVRATNLIYNEYYRDQDLESPRSLGATGVMFCKWEKDYFTTARPWSQKGPSVTVPIGLEAPISVPNSMADTLVGVLTPNQGPQGKALLADSGNAQNNIAVAGQSGSVDLMYADLSQATGVSVNDFRASFAIQRYQEARARYGSRFTEYLRYLGVTPSDARLQRPEFLGGGTTRLRFSEVLQTAEKPDNPGTGVGDLYGHGIAGARTNRFRKFFEEHGYIISLMSVRPKSLYLNGIPREFLKTTKEDYFQKELANLGQQEVYEAELYAENDRDVFGFQDRYQEYRSHPSQVSQDFRDYLNAYHMGRDLGPNPVLNEAFVRCQPSDRIFQVGTGTADSLWIMANNHVVARRIVPKRANPRII